MIVRIHALEIGNKVTPPSKRAYVETALCTSLPWVTTNHRYEERPNLVHHAYRTHWREDR